MGAELVEMLVVPYTTVKDLVLAINDGLRGRVSSFNWKNRMEQKQKWVGSSVDQEVIDAAKYKIGRAQAGNYVAGLSVVDECVIALRGIILMGDLPNAERQLYLVALLESLEKIVDGVDPTKAMCLEKGHGRPLNPFKEDRELSIYLSIGRKYEELIKLGHTKQDKPTEAALKFVAKDFGLTIPNVQKIWSSFGSLKGWKNGKSD